MAIRRSIGAPLTVGIILMLLVIALAVGWQILVWSEPETVSPGEILGRQDWLLLVLGTLFFALVMGGLVWLSTWLVAEVRLNQRQRAFLDAVTHELKTPLASFRLGLDTLGRHQLEPERQREFLDRMQGDLDRLDHTVAQVLAAARAEERRHISQPSGESILLGELLSDCIAPLLERHGIPADAISLSQEKPVWVPGDRADLELIFRNLLENAIKYSDEPVAVRVRILGSSDGRVTVEIEDQGIGIPSWELRKIFRRFHRVSRDVQRQVAGLGLGLFVVRSMLRRQGGRITAESDGVGRGSRFRVTLKSDPVPLHDVVAATAAVHPVSRGS